MSRYITLCVLLSFSPGRTDKSTTTPILFVLRGTLTFARNGCDVFEWFTDSDNCELGLSLQCTGGERPERGWRDRKREIYSIKVKAENDNETLTVLINLSFNSLMMIIINVRKLQVHTHNMHTNLCYCVENSFEHQMSYFVSSGHICSLTGGTIFHLSHP